MRRFLFAMVLGLLFAAQASAQFVPLPNNKVTGPDFANLINGYLSGATASQPSLVCYPFPYLPVTVLPRQLVVCHLCARTNPCALGSYDVIAVGTRSGQWYCDPETGSLQ
jgi:hypothetical protein